MSKRTHGDQNTPSGRALSTEHGPFSMSALFLALVWCVGTTLLASAASAVECTGDPLFITDECTDPRFHDPVIDLVEERTSPVPHTFMHGHFPGTDARFAFYFPPPEKYEGRC